MGRDEIGVGGVIVDLQALQSRSTRRRGIGRYSIDWVTAVEELDRDLVGAYLLNPRLAPPFGIQELAETDKVLYSLSQIDLNRFSIFHSLSPFDFELSISELWPKEVFEAGLMFSATVYDLLPARDLSRSLIDPVERRAYRTRLELVRAADGIQVLSSHVERELKDILSYKGRISFVGASPSREFARPSTGTRDDRQLSSLGIDRPFILYPGGSHPRKNNEALIRAFARLPETLRSGHNLVITGSTPASTRNHYDFLATQLGIAGHVISLGHVDDEALSILYRRSVLVCVPSLGEGFGLPVAEAIACGALVIASDIAPFDELLDKPARFYPNDVAAIADAIASGVSDKGHRATLRKSQHQMPSWREVAERSADALRLLEEGRPKRRVGSRDRRIRVGFVTPLPPSPTGVARYSYRLIEELASVDKINLHVFADGPTPDQVAPEGIEVRSAELVQAFERLCGNFDVLIYAMGNSHHHMRALALLRKRPGIVLCHDVRLTNLYMHEHGDPGLYPGGFDRAVRHMYRGALLPELAFDRDRAVTEDLLCSREVTSLATRVLVNSRAAALLARLDADPDMSPQVSVLPFALESPEQDSPSFVETAQERPAGLLGPSVALFGGPPSDLEQGALLSHFGIVDMVKRPDLSIEALASLRAAGHLVELAFVGPISDSLCLSLYELSCSRGVEEHVIFTGAVVPAAYRKWLEATTVAIQLRATFNGESSAAVGECIVVGIPTIVSRTGWFKELPPGSVAYVNENDAESLTALLSDILTDAKRRSALSRAAKRTAASRTFQATKDALVELITAEARSPGH